MKTGAMTQPKCADVQQMITEDVLETLWNHVQDELAGIEAMLNRRRERLKDTWAQICKCGKLMGYTIPHFNDQCRICYQTIEKHYNRGEQKDLIGLCTEKTCNFHCHRECMRGFKNGKDAVEYGKLPRANSWFKDTRNAEHNVKYNVGTSS